MRITAPLEDFVDCVEVRLDLLSLPRPEIAVDRTLGRYDLAAIVDALDDVTLQYVLTFDTEPTSNSSPL